MDAPADVLAMDSVMDAIAVLDNSKARCMEAVQGVGTLASKAEVLELALTQFQLRKETGLQLLELALRLQRENTRHRAVNMQ